MRAGAIHRIADELVGVGIELLVVAPLHKLQVAGDHAQRLLQVMRGHVSELLELLVALLQRGRVAGKFLL